MPTEPTATPAVGTPLEEIGKLSMQTLGFGATFWSSVHVVSQAHGNLEEHIEDIIGDLVPAMGAPLPITERHLAVMMCNIWLFRIA
jgi:hypothetical protein